MSISFHTAARRGTAALAAVAFGAAAWTSGTRVARADILPVSVQLGPQIPVQSATRSVGGNVQTNANVNFDFGPQTIIPIRASLQVDDATGAAGGGNFNEFGFGVAGRLTTPLYVGAGISLYNTNAHVPVENATVSSTAVGENFFIGRRLLALPGGVTFSVQATYKNIPQFDGIDPSAVGVGLRVQL